MKRKYIIDGFMIKTGLWGEVSLPNILPRLGNSFPCQKNNKDGDRLGHLLLSGKYRFKVRSVCDLINS